MKNAIIYYYNINPNDIHQNNKQFRFTASGENYFLTPYLRNPQDISHLLELSTSINNNRVYCHQIIPNTTNNLITSINNIPYILLKVHINNDDIVTLKDINSFTNSTKNIITNSLRMDNWGELWTKKIDYLEYQIKELGINHPLIKESFSYYVGLGETAINLFNQSKVFNKILGVQHYRLHNQTTLFDLYNPLNFFIDFHIRDACEYLKYCFFYLNYDFNDIREYLIRSDLNADDYQLFFVRMLFPTYYFDIFQEIINNNINENVLIPILKRTKQYEQMLKQLYVFIINYTNIPEIEWLKKT